MKGVVHMKLTPTFFFTQLQSSEWLSTGGFDLCCVLVHADNNSDRFFTVSVLTNGSGTDDRGEIKGKEEFATRPSGKCLFILLCPVQHKKCLQGSQMLDYICSLLCPLERKLKMWRASSRIGTARQLGQCMQGTFLFKKESLLLRNELMMRSGCERYSRKEKRKKCAWKIVCLLWSTNSETLGQSLKKIECPPHRPHHHHTPKLSLEECVVRLVYL